MPEELRKKRSEYMKAHPLRYWAGKKRKYFTLSEEGRAKIVHALKTRIISPKVIAHARNLNKGKFGKVHPCYKKIKKHPFHKLIRELYKYREWRSGIFKRDNFECVLCEKKGYVEADHYPIRFIDIIQKYSIKTLEQAINCKKLWEISNGRTLCKKCHLSNFSRK